MVVKDVMSRDVITITRDETLVDLIAKLRKHNYHTLPVIDEEKNLLGIVNPESFSYIRYTFSYYLFLKFKMFEKFRKIKKYG